MDPQALLVSQFVYWPPGSDFQEIHLIPRNPSSRSHSTGMKQDLRVLIDEDHEISFPNSYVSDDSLRAYHTKSRPETSSSCYSETPRESQTDEIIFDHDNPAKLFPYVGILDYSQIRISRLIPQNTLHTIDPDQKHCLGSILESIYKPRIRSIKRGKISLPQNVFISSKHAFSRYYGSNRFQRQDIQDFEILSYSSYFDPPKPVSPNPIFVLIIISILSVGFQFVLFSASSPPVLQTTSSKDSMKITINSRGKHLQDLRKNLKNLIGKMCSAIFMKHFLYSSVRNPKNVRTKSNISTNNSIESTPPCVLGRKCADTDNIKDSKQYPLPESLCSGLSEDLKLFHSAQQPQQLYAHIYKNQGLDWLLELAHKSSATVCKPDLTNVMTISSSEKTSSADLKHDLLKEEGLSTVQVPVENFILMMIPDNAGFSRENFQDNTSLKLHLIKPNDTVYYKKTSILQILRSVISETDSSLECRDLYNRNGEMRLEKSFLRKRFVERNSPASLEKNSKLHSSIPKSRKSFVDSQILNSSELSSTVEFKSSIASTRRINKLKEEGKNTTYRRIHQMRLRAKTSKCSKELKSRVNASCTSTCTKDGCTYELPCSLRFVESNGNKSNETDSGNKKILTKRYFERCLSSEKMEEVSTRLCLSSHSSGSIRCNSSLLCKNGAMLGAKEMRNESKFNDFLLEFPSSSSELSVARSVFEALLVNDLLPLNIDCLDDPVCALNVGSPTRNPLVFEEITNVKSEEFDCTPTLASQNNGDLKLPKSISGDEKEISISIYPPHSLRGDKVEGNLHNCYHEKISKTTPNWGDLKTDVLYICSNTPLSESQSCSEHTKTFLFNHFDKKNPKVPCNSSEKKHPIQEDSIHQNLEKSTSSNDWSSFSITETALNSNSSKLCSASEYPRTIQLKMPTHSERAFTGPINTTGEFLSDSDDSREFTRADLSSEFPKSILMTCKKQSNREIKRVRFCFPQTPSIPAIPEEFSTRLLSNDLGLSSKFKASVESECKRQDNVRKTLSLSLRPKSTFSESRQESSLPKSKISSKPSLICSTLFDIRKEITLQNIHPQVLILTLSRNGEVFCNRFQYRNGVLKAVSGENADYWECA
ncbi:hypothetical protein METBIDRAFT_230642 [Metschnikowia bicuspidata var. bicuspidata NRRL YB-4993]|uniref:Uncharacterized protein n=1 Tax=Metschnikowia bicuspidata var. bicuspidata NRRL YB-4993 TaxID=869754 RepID=A0A1A0H4V1_9ASCO|nr:hypothetical protein METBIDRAFT_230642 [Metschnikowia bicuspidata var. bicuspidata NRRL YB-4993]OBA18953.1 hypothetical protein METBIDRAFT_230642 [Metschnikowia bicuspidata var. bicuspidata NRRL YB-4993]